MQWNQFTSLFPVEDLSPDLEWMLTSGQASPEALAQALIRAYYLPTYRLAQALLDDSQAAAYASVKAITRAVVEANCYQSGSGIDVWYYRKALGALQKETGSARLQRFLGSLCPPLQSVLGLSEASEEGTGSQGKETRTVCRAVGRLPASLRLPLLLNSLLEWDAPGIARTLGQSTNDVEASLAKAHWLVTIELQKQASEPQRLDGIYGVQKLASGLQRLDGTHRSQEQASEPQRLDGIYGVQKLASGSSELKKILSSRWPAPVLDDDDLDQIAAEVASESSRLGAGQRRQGPIRELLLIAVGGALAAVTLWNANLAAPEPLPKPSPTVQVVVVTQLVTSRPRVVEVTPTAQPDLLYTIQPADTLESAAGRVRIPVEDLRRVNRLPPGLELGPQHVGQQLLTRLPGNPERSPLSLGRPVEVLDEGSDSQAIRDRLTQRQAWDTRWLDARLRVYGPAGYIGPPKEYRLQAWQGERGRQSLILLREESLPDSAIPDLTRSAYRSNLGQPGPDAVLLTTHLGQWLAQPKDLLSPFVPDSLLSLEDNQFLNTGRSSAALLDLPVPTSLSGPAYREAEFRVAGREAVVGIPALIIEQLSQDGELQALLWLEPVSGTVLRKQVFQNPEGIAFEFIVTGVAVNQALPADLLDPEVPWRGGFAHDYTGAPESGDVEPPFLSWELLTGHVPLPSQDPPPGFNPVLARLAFQFPMGFQPSVDLSSTARILADGYLLGELLLPNPWDLMICARSPDGGRIAWAAGNNTGGLHLLQLDPWETWELDDRGHPVAFSFSPDSRRLALLMRFETIFDLVVLDLETNGVQWLQRLRYGDRPVWSPDGQSLALTGRLADGFEDELVVVQVRDGNIAYRTPDNIASDLPEDAPVREWGVEFPAWRSGLEGCVYPP